METRGCIECLLITPWLPSLIFSLDKFKGNKGEWTVFIHLAVLCVCVRVAIVYQVL